jgi:hypothetical protein
VRKEGPEAQARWEAERGNRKWGLLGLSYLPRTWPRRALYRIFSAPAQPLLADGFAHYFLIVTNTVTRQLPSAAERETMRFQSRA